MDIENVFPSLRKEEPRKKVIGDNAARPSPTPENSLSQKKDVPLTSNELRERMLDLHFADTDPKTRELMTVCRNLAVDFFKEISGPIQVKASYKTEKEKNLRGYKKTIDSCTEEIKKLNELLGKGGIMYRLAHFFTRRGWLVLLADFENRRKDTILKQQQVETIISNLGREIDQLERERAPWSRLADKIMDKKADLSELCEAFKTLKAKEPEYQLFFKREKDALEKAFALLEIA